MSAARPLIVQMISRRKKSASIPSDRFKTALTWLRLSPDRGNQRGVGVLQHDDELMRLVPAALLGPEADEIGRGEHVQGRRRG